MSRGASPISCQAFRLGLACTREPLVACAAPDSRAMAGVRLARGRAGWCLMVAVMPERRCFPGRECHASRLCSKLPARGAVEMTQSGPAQMLEGGRDCVVPRCTPEHRGGEATAARECSAPPPRLVASRPRWPRTKWRWFTSRSDMAPVCNASCACIDAHEVQTGPARETLIGRRYGVLFG